MARCQTAYSIVRKSTQRSRLQKPAHLLISAITLPLCPCVIYTSIYTPMSDELFVDIADSCPRRPWARRGMRTCRAAKDGIVMGYTAGVAPLGVIQTCYIIQYHEKSSFCHKRERCALRLSPQRSCACCSSPSAANCCLALARTMFTESTSASESGAPARSDPSTCVAGSGAARLGNVALG